MQRDAYYKNFLNGYFRGEGSDYNEMEHIEDLLGFWAYFSFLT